MLYTVLVFAWAVDFRSDGARQGLAIQAVLLAIYLVALVFYAANPINRSVRIRWLGPLMVTGALYLAVGIGTGLFNDQDLYPVMRNAMSVFVFLSAAYATSKAAVSIHPTRLKLLLTTACLAYAVLAFVIFDRMSGGVELNRVRHQIIGGSAVAGLGLVALAVMFRLTLLQVVTLLINLAILIISVTRTYLLVFAAQALFMAVEFRRLITPRITVLVLASGIVAAAIIAYAQSQLYRWEDRLGAGTGAGQELYSWFTRTSEWEFMIREWMSSPLTFLFGRGFGGRTQYFYPPELGGFSESMIGFGHNQHISFLFSAGVIGGLPMLVVLWINGWTALHFLRQAARNPGARSDLVFLGAWGATIVLGTLAADMLTSTFMLRVNSLWYGIGTGLLLGVRACFDPRNAHGRSPAGPGSPR